jgi:hypothetical protein
LLAAEAHRDSDTWAIHLLDLKAQGLNPDYVIADAGTGLRAGQKIAWPDTPCHGDIFHIQQQFETVVNLWTRIAGGATSECEQLEARLSNARSGAFSLTDTARTRPTSAPEKLKRRGPGPHQYDRNPNEYRIYTRDDLARPCNDETARSDPRQGRFVNHISPRKIPGSVQYRYLID